MTYEIRFNKQINWIRFAKLPRSDRMRIREAINGKLTQHPEVFGKPLRQSLTGARSLRVGEYRVIYTIVGTMVEIILFGHRLTIYEDAKEILG